MRRSNQTRVSRRSFLRAGGASGIALAIVPGLLAGCGDSDASSQSDGGALAAELQLSWIKSMSFAGPFLAAERGYYDDTGVAVALLGGGPSVDQIAVVASGNALLGMADSNEIAVARGQGIPVVALATPYQKSPFAMMSLSESPVLSLKDQYGKRVAVSDTFRPTLETLMSSEGLDPTKVELVPKNEDPSVLADGLVDVYWGNSTSDQAPLAARGVKTEAVLLSDLGERTYASTYFATVDSIGKDREAIVRLLAADLAGWKWAVENNAETAMIIRDKYQSDGTELDVVIAQGEAQIPLITADPMLLAISPSVFEVNIQSAVDGGLIESTYDVSDVVDTTLLEEARKIMPS